MVSDKPKKVLGFLKSKAKKRERDSSKTRSSRDSEDLRVEGGRHPPERRESGRFPSAARLLRSLGRNRDDEGGGARARDTSEPSLSRGNPHYHSEGKGLKKKNNWTSERELNSVSPTQKERSHSFCEKTDSKRRFSYHENKVLREEAKTRLDRQEEEGPLQADGTPLPSEASPVHSALSPTISSSASQVPSSPTTPGVPSSAHPLSNEKGDENIYENLPAHMNTSDTVTLSACDGQKQPDSVERLQNEVQTARPLERADKDRRSVRKLTKDSGYETSPYSEGDYANIDLYSDADALPDGDGDDVTLAPECELAPPSPLLESATHISGSSSPSIQNTPTSTHQHSPSQLSISGSQERRSSWQLPGSGSSSNIAAAAVSHQPDLCAARGVSPSCTSLSSSQGTSHEARPEANSNTSNSRVETRLDTTSNNTNTLTKRSANTATKSSASRRSPLPRYPSAESLSSFAESLVSPGGASSSSLVPAKSTPSLHQNASGQAHNFSVRHSSVNAALHASRSTPNLDDAEDGSMVTKKSSMYSYLHGTSSPSSKGGMGGSGVVGGRYWDVTMGADDTPDREDYAHHLRSSSYQLLHSRQLSALSSGSAGSYHSRQHSNTSNYSETDDLSPRADLSSSHSHHSHHHGIDRPRFFSYDNLGPDPGSHKYHGSWNISEPDLTSAPPPYSPPGPNYQQPPTPPSTTTASSTVRHSPTSNSSSGRHPSSPPPPPVRDASSLKYIKYGPGHEKYPSWPVPAASANQVIHPGSSHDANVSGLPDSTALSPAPQGSHRSKSWTEQSEYPKEKAGGYARPFNKKPSNQAYHRQLKTVMERSEKLPKEVFHSTLREDVFSGSDYSFMDAYCKPSSFYPSYDRDGRTLDDKDYRSPSPPERDIGMGEATFGQVTAAQLEEHRRRYEDYNYDLIGTTPLLDQLRCDSLIWEGNTERDSVRGESESVADSSRYSNGRESVTTVVTNSSSASSSETLKWHGSLSDISIMSGHSRDPRADHNIVHSSRVQAPQRHNSESVLYYGADGRGKPPHGRLASESRDHRDLRRSIRDTESGYPRPSREGKWSREVERNNEMNNLKKFPSYSYTQPLSQITEAPSAEMRETPRSPTRSMQSPTVDCSKPPSVAERIHELERQSRTTVSENSTRGPRDQSNSRERDNREVRDRRDSREREPQEMRERDSRDCKDRGTRESRRSLDESCSQEVHDLGQTPEVRPARESRDPSETRGHQRRGSRDSQRGDMRLDFSRLEQKEPPSLTGSDTLRSPTTPGSAGSTSSRSPTCKEQDSGRAFVHENFQNILNTFTEVDRGDRMDRLSSNVSYSYLDPEKRRKVPDATLKSIQKQAVMSFVYERHGGRGMTGQSVSDLSSASSQSSLISSHSAPETTQAKWSTVQQQHPSNQNMRTDKSGKAGKGMARLGRVPESEGDEQTVRHSRRRSMSGRDSGSECGTEDLSRGGSQRSSLASDAASSRGEQPPAFPQKQAQQHPHPEVVARSSSTSSAHSTSANEDPKPTEEAEPCRDDDGTYHKDSYMAHRRDWKTGFEGRYRRTISPSAANRNLLYNRDDNTNNNQSNASNNNNNINNSSSSATSTSPLPLPPQEQQERRNSSTPPGGGTVHRNHSSSNLVQTNNSKNANDYDSSVNNNGWTCHGHTTSTTVNFTAEELRAFKARRAHAHIQDAGSLPLEKDGGGRPLHTSQSSPALSSALRSAASDGSTTSLASGGGGSSLSSGHSGSASPTKLSPASSLRASVDSLHRPSSSTSTITSHSPRPITRATSLADPLHPPDDLSVARSNSMSQEAIHFTSTASINESLSRISAINDSLSRSTSMADSLCRSTSVTEAPSVAPAGPQIHAHNASETASPSSSSPPHQSSPSSAPAASTVPTAPASPTSPVPHDGPITAHPATVTEEVSPAPPPPLTISNKSLTTKSPPSPKSPLASKSLTPVSPLSPKSPFSSKSPVSSSTSPVLSPTSSKMCAFPSVSNCNNSSVSNNSSPTSLAVTSSLDTTTTATTTLSYPITSPSMSPATLPVDHSIIVLSYGRTRYQEEIDCDQLSKDYGPQLTVDSKLLALLAPGPEYKTAAHYMQGVFSLELRKDFISSTHAQHPDLSHIHQNSAMPPNTSTATNGVANTSNEKAPLPSDSAYFTTSESKAKLLTRLRGNGSSLQDGVTTVTDQQQLHKKKEELVASIGRKLEILRAEREAIKEEMRLNQELGSEVTSLVEERARLAESEKYKLHVEEIDKITSLLLGLSGRLARAENALMLSKEADPEERRILEGKRDKLSEQLEEAKRLKENIDRRAIQVSKVLNQYLNEDEYADYDHFIKMKAKLIMDAREIDDKIKLGEEQQQALIETICKK
ncbi:protein Shroom-like isoform X4 [Macrobrachium rosenbergii]|uniref:protein Shroom-like isoform X4 n=1 Tax=Macrobrachium rosenbergii TaxID=79674 RepID=UPI0034D5D119